MKICVTSTGRSLDASLGPLFGRCRHFVTVGSGVMEFEALQKPRVTASCGAGYLV